jgi:calcineurin-like phosphoesterase family protein
MLKITLQEGQKLWVTSDTHYSHKNICSGVSDWVVSDNIGTIRNFDTLDDMNDTIVRNINSVVGVDDVILHFGDWSFGGFDKIMKFYDKLNCKNIHLILGNHDEHIEKNKENIQSIFKSINTLVDVSVRWGRVNKKDFIACHYPIASWNTLKRGTMHLHGHTHLTGDRRFGNGKRMDIGIDGHPEFRPYDFVNEIIPIMDKREIKSEIFKDHHAKIETETVKTSFFRYLYDKYFKRK